METKTFDVFISHSSKDAHAASAIKQHLQACDIRCWKAPDDIMPGESWPQAILRAIGNSRAMVLIWSTNSTSSGEVSKELTLAMRNNLIVVPFRIENVPASGEWEYHLANTHWMDAFSGEMKCHVNELASYLKRIFQSKVKDDPEKHSHQSKSALDEFTIKIESVISDIYLSHRLKYPLPKNTLATQENPSNSSAPLLTKFLVAIKPFFETRSEVAFIDEINLSNLIKHKYASSLDINVEKPLFLVNTNSEDTGMILTNQYLYYSLTPLHRFYITLQFAPNVKGKIPIKEIQSIFVGEKDGYNNSCYTGHELSINGNKIGWLRMGIKSTCDHEVLNATTQACSELTEKIFSNNNF
jgi:hypothetical protein